MLKITLTAFLVLSSVLSSLADSRDYKLGVGDQIRIKVYEWPDLSGEFRIGPEGLLFLSIVDQIAAEGLTSVELARVISERLKQETRDDRLPHTTVEITQFRPFFILGDVQQPGEYTYRPGLTVLQAISIAGGIYRMTETSLQNHANAIASRGQLAMVGLEIDQLIARKARLDAELKGLDEVQFPQSLVARNDEVYIGRLMTEERLLFETNKTRYAQQFEVLTGLQAFYEAEADSLAEQSRDAHRQLTSAEQQLENVESLVERRLAPATRQFEMEQMVAGMRANQRQLEINVLKARQSIAETSQRLLDLYWQRRDDTIVRSQQTEAALEAARQRLVTQALIVEEDASAAAMLQRQHEEIAVSALQYEIVRKSGSDIETTVTDEHALVEPGDVIRVRRVVTLPSGF